MVKQTPYEIIYAVQFADQLATIDAKHHSLIRERIEEQLRFEPKNQTRNRKPLQRPLAWNAEWELRFGPDNCFRVFYRVETRLHQVQIVAIGVKIRDRLFVAGEEVPR